MSFPISQNAVRNLTRGVSFHSYYVNCESKYKRNIWNTKCILQIWLIYKNWKIFLSLSNTNPGKKSKINFFLTRRLWMTAWRHPSLLACHEVWRVHCVVKWTVEFCRCGSQFGSCRFYRNCFELAIGGSRTFAMLFRESDYVLRCWLVILKSVTILVLPWLCL